MTPPPLRERLARARTFLFATGTSERRMASALRCEADVVILDLEDAVAPGDKRVARQRVGAILEHARPAPGQVRLVRVNSVDGSVPEDDLAAAAAADGIVLPKCDAEAAKRLARDALVLVETASGLRESFAIASAPRAIAVALGGEDLSAELGLSALPDEAQLLPARSQLVRDCAAARARAPIDVVHTDIADLDGLRESAARARALGMRGKLCIHPRQLNVVQVAFTPTAAEIEWAQDVIGWLSARGVATVEGEMVDAAVAKRARSILLEAQ